MDENEDFDSRPTSPLDGLIANEAPSSNSVHNVNRSKSVLSRDVCGTELIYHNVEYSVKVKVKRKKVEKQILKGCSGIMKPGINAILGPTGSGKTTLIDVLAGRKEKKDVSGTVLINGKPQPDDFRLISGFVVQDDVVMGTLTVRENLFFSAALRLPKHFRLQDRKDRVNMIINELGLDICADNRVGSESRRGISGGERKRTCIGMELVISPDILFLDEPTTGLDASTACSLVKLLRKQAAKGRNIIFSIHQPRYSIFKLFDNLTLMSDGEVVYHGPCHESIEYFTSHGYICETYNNPADYYMDILWDEMQKKKAISTDEESYIGFDNKHSESRLVDLFKSSTYYKQTLEEIQPSLDSLESFDEVDMKDGREMVYQSSFCRQLRYVMKRTGLNMIRDPRGITSQFFVMLIYAIITGAIYWQLDLNSSGLQNRVGVFFFMLMNQVFSNMSAIAIFINERPIFRNECSNGYYRVSTYFLSKIFCDILPLRVIPLAVYVGIVYFMIGLQLEVDRFFVFFFALLTASLTGSAICIFVSSSVELLPVANILVTLPFVFMMVFSGFLVKLSDIPVWLQWLKYLSIFKYALASLEINEFENLDFTGCGPHKNLTCTSGLAYLNGQGISVNDLWVNQAVLIGAILVLYFFSYIQLRRLKKTV